jgi:parvulin-like peptidyl-prolyl isomerase
LPGPPTLARTAAAAALAGLGLAAAATAPAAELLNQVVLRINGRIVTLYDYEQRKAETQREVLSSPQVPLERRRELLNNLGEIVFRDLFEEALLLSRADQTDLRVGEKEVDDALARVRQNAGLETDAQFEAALAGSGLSRAALRAQIRRNLVIQTLISREVQSKIEIDEEILRRWYRDHPDEFRVPVQLRLRELVVLEDSGLAPDERLRLAEKLRQEALAGRPLAELAEAHAAAGETSGVIDHGWVGPGDLAPDLERAAWGLAAGEVSEPVGARGGLHLIEVVERREGYVRPFVEVADAIRARERERRGAEKYQDYLAELEEQAFIVADPPAEAKEFRRALGAPGLASPLGAEAAAAEVAAEKAAGEEEAPAPAGVSDPAAGAGAAAPPPSAPAPDEITPPPADDGGAR